LGALFAGVGVGVLLIGMIPIIADAEYRWIFMILTTFATLFMLFQGVNKLRNGEANKKS